MLSSRFEHKLSFMGKERELSFTDLKAIEAYRRALLIHTKNGQSVDFMCAFTGTLLPYVFSDYLFWITMFLYGIVRFMIWRDPTSTQDFPLVILPQVLVIGGFLNYFLVFFTSHSYNRFMVQYNKVMAAKGAIYNFTLLAKNNLPRARAMRILRWLQSSYLLSFVGLSVAYERDNFFLPLSEKYQLLTKLELERLNEIGADSGGIAYREVLSWVTDEVAALGKERIMPDKICDSMWKEIIRTAENLAAMFDYEDQPIPFVYVHLTYIMALAYLPLLAYCLALSVPPEFQSTGVELLGFLTIFLSCLFVLGLRDLGHILQDPFGDDLQDMSVMHYVTDTIDMSRRLLKGSQHAVCDESWELQNEADRPVLGAGFEDHIVNITITVPLPQSDTPKQATAKQQQAVGTVQTAEHVQNVDTREMQPIFREQRAEAPLTQEVDNAGSNSHSTQ